MNEVKWYAPWYHRESGIWLLQAPDGAWVRYSDYAALKTELDEWKRGSETVNSQLLKRIELLEAQLSKAQHLLREDMEIFEADLMSIGHGPDSLARTRSMTGLGDRIAKLDEFLNPNKDP